MIFTVYCITVAQGLLKLVYRLAEVDSDGHDTPATTQRDGPVMAALLRLGPAEPNGLEQEGI